ncbi:MAG: PilZ domain-containing protein [Bacteriovoracia bacterium]
MDHLLESLSQEEMSEILLKASLFGGQVTHPTPTRNLSIEILTFDLHRSGKLIIKLKEKINIHDKWPVTVKLNYRNISFQIEPDFYWIEDDILIGELPKKARAIPARDNKRFVLPLNSKIVTTLHRSEKRGETCDLNGTLLDISEKGLGIVVSTPDEELLKANDHVWITSINSEKLPGPVFARIVYVYSRRFRDTVDLRAGLSLESSLPLDVTRKLKDMSSLTLKG